MKERIRRMLDQLPYIRTLSKELQVYKTHYPPGHYYSPIVDKIKVRAKENEIFTINSNRIEGLELFENNQFRLLSELSDYYNSVPFKDEKTENMRYYFKNEFYSYSDAIFLHLIIRYFKPKSIIEIGSGFSSAVMLDTNEIFFNKSINLTFIDPYPERLFSLCKDHEKQTIKVLNLDLQDVDIDVFDNLQENDILFVDSTHVSKTGSDVNKIIFDILPRLNKGVLIHFHDIFYPFEYPKAWVINWSEFGWNEDYILKAFLMYNNQFKIIMFNTFMEHFHKDWFLQNMPNCLKNEGGSLWIQKQ